MHILVWILALAAFFCCAAMLFRARPNATVCVFLLAALLLGTVVSLDGPYLLQGGCVKEVETLYVLRSGGGIKNRTYALSDGEGNTYWGFGELEARYTAGPPADTRARITYLPYSGLILSVESRVLETNDSLVGCLLFGAVLCLPVGMFALAARRRRRWRKSLKKVRRQASAGREEIRRTFRIGRGG